MERKITHTVKQTVVTQVVKQTHSRVETHGLHTHHSSHTVSYQESRNSTESKDDRALQAHRNGSLSHHETLKTTDPTKASPSIGGFIVPHTKDKVTIYQAIVTNLVSEEVAVPLLEAQAATGGIIQLSNNQTLSVEAAIQQGVVGAEYQPKLIIANGAVLGYKGREETLSLYQAFKKGLVSKMDTVRFLEAQVATGGIIDQVNGSRVSVSEALKLNYIDEHLLKTLTEGSELSKCYLNPNTKDDSTYQELTSKCFTDPGTGLLLFPLHETLQGLRKPVTSDQLFKANIITQVQYDEINQGKQIIQSLGELQEVHRYLQGEPSIGGVYIESTKEKMSVYQAMKKNFLPSDTAVALLEAQAASGFIIDPVKNRRFTVTEAIQEELIGLELKEKLQTAERAVTGFNDPYTGNKISLFQAIKKELIDKKLGVTLLEVQIATGGIIDPFHSFHVPLQVAYQRGLLDKDIEKVIFHPTNDFSWFLDPNTDDLVTYQELRKRCTMDPESNTFMFPVKLSFNGLRGKVTSDELLDSLIIDKTTYDLLQQGKILVQDVAAQEKVRRYLQGTGCIAGVAVVSTNERKNIYQAMKEHLLMPGTSIALLEAQAATGYLVDPMKNLKFSVEEAVKNGLIGTEVYEKLLSAEKAARGYKDPSSGESLSLFQAMKKGFVTQNHGIHLLEVQFATGGIIDPLKKHRVPEEVAYTRGFLDKEMNKSFLDPTDDLKGFFDPNAKQNLTYGQLLERCLVDAHTGLYLIPVFDNAHDALKTPHSFIEYQVKKNLDQIKLTGTSGKFKGQVVSMWQLLFSEYFTTEFRESLFKQYKSGSLSVEELSSKVEAAIQDLVSSTKVTFEGLRVSVTPGQLFESEIIDKDLFEKLQQGEASAKDVVNIDTVKKYLQGTGSIGGLLLTDTQEKMSIYQAKRKGFLRPGTSLILLEAQAATGFITDPVKSKKYSVDDALKANIIGPEVYEKLLSAEKSVTGYKDPYTGEVISLFQAMSKDLIVKDHGIRLLEAQIATGGIIDPINSHRIPVEVAYKRGYFDKKMNVILSDPSDDTKGFFDPNTSENLTYLQLKERCVTDPATSLCLLPLFSRKRQLNINDYIKDSFRNLEIYVRYGRFKGQTVSAWVLINSEYFNEWRRREILEQFRLRKVTIEQVVILIEEEIKKWTEICVPALRGQVNLYDLLEYEMIDKDLFEQVLEGKLTADDVFKMETVQRYLRGSGVLGGILIQPSNQRIGFYEATKKNILQTSTVLPLLEAQAATGSIIDPVKNQRLSVDEALKAKVIDSHIYNRLVSAEEALTGYRDPFSGKKISLFQAMKKGLIEEKHAKQLLEAQLATGGIIDPIHNFHIPSSVAKKLGYINEEVHESLSHPTDDSKSFYDPSTKENVTYSDLLSRSQKDESTGIYLLPLPQDFAEVPVQNIYTDEEVQLAFKNTRIEERNTTVWELIHSGYFTEEQRVEILEKYKSKKVSLEELITEILQIVKNNEIKMTTHLSFQGLRGKVPVVWLLDLGIITQKTFNELVQGIASIEEVSELDHVKKCLQGTGCITGVFLPSTKEKMSIYQAMKKNLVMPAYGVMLLEAQAATGFIIDPIKNEKHTVDSAVKSGVVGPELHEKLLIAESAVTGYIDPYTGNKISLGEAINKELVPEKEGLPLLQAQLATGGIVDPIHCHYVPLQVAHKMGFLDEELSKQTDTLKMYFDPNVKEKLSYQQLKERCYSDPETGSLLLPLSESAAFYAEGHLIDVLKSVPVNVNAGRFKGQSVSLWELLNSEYVSVEKLKELLHIYKNSSTEVLQEIIKTVTTIIEETDASSTKIKFKGLRKQVSASDLFQSNVIDKQTLDELNLGKKTIVEVTEMDNVKRYLQGTNCIAGILLQSTNTKMSIYEAMLKRILRPGTALVLLEAQAATGFIVDPVQNRKLSVDEALAEGFIGLEVHAKLLSAEQAVTGYTDPYSGEKISLFQAMQKNLIVECHGIRLLEAQIATGGIIDPVHSHRVPVEVAYKRGYFDEDMNKTLLDPSDDTKGFFDPNTHENLTYLQLVERCIQDPETGLYLLQVVKKGENYFYITDQMKSDLKSRHIRLQIGKFANQTVTIWEILSSHYFTELKKRELVKLYTVGVLSIEQLISSLTTIIEEYEATSSILKFQGIRGQVSATELYNSDIIDKKTMDDLKEGRQSVESISQLENVKRYLKGTGCISGVLILPNKETISIFEAMKRGIISRDIGLILLEAQISTGFLVDPSKNQALSISEALSAGLISEDDHQQLDIAEKAFTGFTDPESGRKISLFQAIKKGILPKEQGIPLLDSQLATGGIVDPINSYRLPLHVAYRKGYLDEDLYILISDSVNGRKGFVDPNTHERLTYKDLLERCVKDAETGTYLVQVAEKRDDYFYIDDPTKKLLISTAVKMNEGKFKGQDISLWDLLCSTYISEENRKDLIKKYKLKTSNSIKEIISIILSIIEDKEKGQNDIWFQGLRKLVTASELFDAGIISKETLDGLQQEPKTVVDVAQTESIRRYLGGSSCIAGVLIPSKHDPTQKEKLNIYDALLRRLLRPGTALVLLEAQAATGFVIDCVHNTKLSVDEALPAGLIGHEIYEKLLCAEKGVTGYTDPYTGDKISLFQAMQKDLIVKEHGVRLLEAQIATGGIIDPVHSHRVPVEVAYKRGYFNEDLNQILSDPTEDTKGFFDPNTHENLTYLQLLQRCVKDPDTGLYMLELKHNRFSLSQIQTTLRTRMIQVSTGEFQGKSVSIWELLNSKHISNEKRDELLKKYETGILTIEDIIKMVIKIITEETVNVSKVDTTDSSNQDVQVQELLQAERVDISLGDFKGQSLSLWELLNSRYFSQDKRLEILQRLKYGTLTIQETIIYVIKIITEAESIKTTIFQQNVGVTGDESVEAETSVQDDEIQRALQSINLHVEKGQYAGQEVSVWDLLHSRYISDQTQQELLEDYKLTVQDIMEMVIQSIKEADQKGKSALMLEYNLKEDIYNTLLTVKIDVTEGEFKGQTHTLWDLLSSKYFSKEKKQELLDKFNSGKISVEKLIKMIITIISETEERRRQLKFKGLRRQVTATELLTSEIIDQNMLTELAQGRKTVEEVTQMDSVKRYLEGTSCIAGVLVPSLKDPSKKDKMTIYNAMLKNILRPGTALVLLEAQAATGFVIDPVNNKKLSVDEAASAGIIGSELHKKLLSAERAVTGYKDPYTGDKISLFQAMQKDLIVKDHGIRLLEAQIATGGIVDPVHSHRVPVEVAYKRGYFDEEMNQILSDPTDDTKGFFDPNTHKNLTYLQLLNRCIQDPETGLCMLDMKAKTALPTSKTLEASLTSHTLQVKTGQYKDQTISIWVLLHSEYFTEEKRQLLLKQYKSGTISIEELITTIITTIEEWEHKGAGQFVKESSTTQQEQEEKPEDRLKSELVEVTKGKSEGQKVPETENMAVAEETDGIVSPLDKPKKTSTDEDLHKTLNIFTVRVKKEEFQSKRVSLWDILHSKYISEEQRNTQLNKYQTSLEKVKQTIKKLVEGSEKKSDLDIQQELGVKLTVVTAGEFTGQNLSVWFLLHSKYITEKKRKELIEKYRSGALTIEELLKTIVTIIEETEKSHNLKFKGFRRPVTATELLQSEIIDQNTLNELNQGSKTVEEVTQMDNVKRYLEGTSCIAGVFVTSKKDPSQRDKKTIYDAMFNRILRPGTALVLLEAQAATGFVIDPIENKKLSVDEALSAGLIGREIYDKLLSAERGVTGYKDPYTDGKISLFQAMKKDLIVKDHGIRLLEAQIATGGIIDPIHSHRVPVEVAYKRGYFDEEINQILSDPTDDTKGFFDPNTHENLTYLQLLQRCVKDPDTGLSMLEVGVNKFPSTQIGIETILKSKNITVRQGPFKGKDIAIWEILNSEQISVEQREELLRKYKSGTLSIDELINIITKIIHTKEETSTETTVQTLLQSHTLDVSVGDFRGQNVSVWELLHSRYISEDKRKGILEKLESGALSIQEAITILFTIITETEDFNTSTVHQDVTAAEPTASNPSIQDDGIEKALRSINIDVMKGQYAGQQISVWDLIHSRYIPEGRRQELLGNYKLTVEDIIQIVAQSIEKADQKRGKSTLHADYNVKTETYNTLQTVQTEVTLGEFKGQKHSLWELLNTKYFSEEKKLDLLKNVDSNAISINKLIKIITTLIEETEERSKNLKFKGLRRQVTATELLTSEIIDQNMLTELTQGRKTVEEVTQMDSVKRYLEGTSCIAGVLVPSLKDPSKKDKMTIYNAMLKNILRPGTALVLLEAQAATGFVIDPVNNKKLSVDEAASAGIIGPELHKKLLSAERAVTGYKDPYTGDKISLFQAMQKDLIVKDHGIRLLEAQIATGGIIDPVHSHRVPVEVAYKRGYFDEEMNQVLSDPTDDTKGFFDPNTHENLTYLQLLNRCIQDSDTKLYMLVMRDKKTLAVEKTLEASLTSHTLQVKTGQYKDQTISIWVLLHSEYFTEEKRQLLLKQYKSGTISIEELITTIRTTIEEWEHKGAGQFVNGSSTTQQEKQEDRLKSELVEVTKGKFQGQKVSVWELLHSDYITESKKKEILQNYSSGIWNLEEIIRIITINITESEENDVTTEKTETDGMVSTPLLEENVARADGELHKALNAIAVNITTGEFQEQKPSLWKVLHSRYLSEGKRNEQLSKHQVTVEKVKQTILQLIQDSEPKSDQEIQKELELKFAEVRSGEFKGQQVSVWSLLHSKYITVEKRQELYGKYRSGALTIEELLKTIVTIIEETEKSHNLKFKGFRRPVTATELLQSEIIDQTTLNELNQGSKTVEEVTQMDNVKRYLEGTSCIAGVFVTSKKDPSQREKKTIYDSMFNRILRPGTALVLLEAQAATGFVIDPIENKKLSVDEALSAGLIGREIYDKLLSAERGVTGYKDPYTDGKISLFQAMKKDLIVKDHGIRLLEAQIATGGIIDPIHSHRVPVEVAYKRGYFDEEMNQILSDPTDDTKGFFDPNTHENLTYLQLLQRCVKDPDTGLYMLDVRDRKLAIQIDQKIKSVLQSRTITFDVGEFKGKDVSVWDLLYSQYISVEKQEDLLKKYRAGTLTIDELITIIITIITETKKANTSVSSSEGVKKTFQSVTIEIFKGSFQEESMSLWDLLHSKYIPEDQREELLEKFKSGTLTIEEIINIVLSVIHKSSKTEVIVKEEVKIISSPADVDHWPSEQQLKNALQVIPSDLSEKPLQPERVSAWDLLNSETLPKDKKNELLQTFKCSVREVMRACSSILKESCSVEVLNMNEEQQKTLQSTMTQVSAGHFKGQTVSVWDLLHSNYFTSEKRREILSAYTAGTLTAEDIIKVIITVIRETEERSSQLKFKGLRRQISAEELLSSEIIDQKTLNELTQGSKTLEEVTKMDSVKRYLEGTSSIAGVFVPSKKDPSKKEKMSIYQAMWKQILRPGTALVLLEAQAATGFIIDPINNKKLSVDVSVSAGVIGKELHAKLLSAERAVTGYNDPYTEKKISLFQAMKKNLIVKEHGIRLLEAQIATGGIIDPVQSHRVPVEVAYKRGYFDKEMNEILSDPSDDTKGFFDPNTHANLTYLQLLQRGIQDPETGLCMLEIKDSRSPLFQIDQAKQNILQTQTVEIKIGQYQGQKFSLWELLSSHHLVEVEKERQGLLAKYKAGTMTLENLMTSILSLIEKMETTRSAHSLELSTTSSSIHESEAEQANKRIQTQKFLQSVDLNMTVGQLKGHKSSLWELLNSSYITCEKKNELIAGYESERLSLEDLMKSILEIFMKAEKANLEMSSHQTLTMSSEKAKDAEYPQAIQHSLQEISLDNYNDEFTGRKVSVWDILHSKPITQETRCELLRKYHSTVQTVVTILTDLVHKKAASPKSDTATFLKSVKVEVNIGEFKLEGKTHSLWDLLYSKYVTEDKRKELLEKYESKSITWEEIFQMITKLIEETEEKSRNIKFSGLRKQVSASELLKSEIIDQDTLLELTHGTKTLAEVTQMNKVKRYLEGTSCIAGVLVPSTADPTKKEKMSIYDAMLKRILRPGTALVLLEAQAATGFIIDPIKNSKLTVDEAVSARVFGQELHPKLLSAERAVTGYNDPTTSQKISLFQAMQKDLIVKDHGIRLLEAQIATGGIIDPVHSHRVPVEVAYKRGYFDEEMNQILSDPSDDTKGFFDPNTHENLTYLQLLQRAIQDPETGLLILEVTKK
ncbi:epiplakin [Rhinoderma darwinii]|uniref:epiplakin n=1 Tax=Rhinoderma darwinii TaxID=43563 RepID=UPI003F675F7D